MVSDAPHGDEERATIGPDPDDHGVLGESDQKVEEGEVVLQRDEKMKVVISDCNFVSVSKGTHGSQSFHRDDDHEMEERNDMSTLPPPNLVLSVGIEPSNG